MPITHAELIYNTGNFVRDYPFVMDRTEQNAHGAAPGAPAANGYGQVAIHGILANIYTLSNSLEVVYSGCRAGAVSVGGIS